MPNPIITITSTTLVLPLNIVSDEVYSSITLRGMGNQWPTTMYDSGSYPLRELSFWPVPQAANAVELWLWEPLFTYETLDDELNLPPGYERYLRFKLAAEVAAEFGKEVPQAVAAGLMEAEANVKRLNQQLPVQHLSRKAQAMGRSHQSWTYLDTISGGDVLPWRP